MTKNDLEDLRSELDDFAQPKKTKTRSPQEERVIAGFEEIQKFFEENGRLPEHGEDKDIFERLYAVRLDQIRKQEECRSVVQDLDHQRLLAGDQAIAAWGEEEMDVDALSAELGGEEAETQDITQLRHVRSSADKRAAEEIANRDVCKDFDRFKPLFLQVRKDLDRGVREMRRFAQDASISQGEYFILGGQTVYVAHVGEEFVTEYDRRDSRLRVIYDNGTESDLLLRSLQRALYKDEAGRRITNPSAGPLFSAEPEDGDLASGTIYVLRSKSDDPFVQENRDVLHKIGVTGGSVEKRIAKAKLDPTFLMADVEVVRTYELYNINRAKLENLIHKIFEPGKLNIEIKDRFGNPIVPREWFLAPLFAIQDAVNKIKDGTITSYIYDAQEAKLVSRESND